VYVEAVEVARLPDNKEILIHGDAGISQFRDGINPDDGARFEVARNYEVGFNPSGTAVVARAAMFDNVAGPGIGSGVYAWANSNTGGGGSMRARVTVLRCLQPFFHSGPIDAWRSHTWEYQSYVSILGFRETAVAPPSYAYIPIWCFPGPGWHPVRIFVSGIGNGGFRAPTAFVSMANSLGTPGFPPQGTGPSLFTLQGNPGFGAWQRDVVVSINPQTFPAVLYIVSHHTWFGQPLPSAERPAPSVIVHAVEAA
jgi:hypothetical protein